MSSLSGRTGTELFLMKVVLSYIQWDQLSKSMKLYISVPFDFYITWVSVIPPFWTWFVCTFLSLPFFNTPQRKIRFFQMFVWIEIWSRLQICGKIYLQYQIISTTTFTLFALFRLLYILDIVLLLSGQSLRFVKIQLVNTIAELG